MLEFNAVGGHLVGIPRCPTPTGINRTLYKVDSILLCRTFQPAAD